MDLAQSSWYSGWESSIRLDQGLVLYDGWYRTRVDASLRAADSSSLACLVASEAMQSGFASLYASALLLVSSYPPDCHVVASRAFACIFEVTESRSEKVSWRCQFT